jgi:HEXXH motif-containing protein
LSELERAYRGFASPFEPFLEEFLQEVTVAHARMLMRRFLDCFAARLKQRSDGLVSALERWLGSSTTFEDVWDVAFGRLTLCLQDPPAADIVFSAAEAALRIAERGGKADWEARFDRPTRPRVGPFLLPATDRLRVGANGRQLDLEISRGKRKSKQTLPHPVRFDTPAGNLERLTVVGGGESGILILRKTALGADSCVEDVRVDRMPDTIGPPLETVLRLIGRHSPPYLAWLGRVVRQILPLRDDPSTMMSSTAAWRSGVLYSANRPDPAALAEMLIHEGTHQYMYILRRLGSLDDGSDPNLYYSPISRQMRPLGVIVLAYHALGNITLFCRACPPGSPVRPRQIEASLAGALAAFEGILRQSRSVTPIGRALWQPLYERLHADGSGRLSAPRLRGTARKDVSESCRNTTPHRPKLRRTTYPTTRPPDRAARMTSRAPFVR